MRSVSDFIKFVPVMAVRISYRSGRKADGLSAPQKQTDWITNLPVRRSETTNRASDLLELRVHAAEEDALVLGKLVHRLEADVEARVGVVDGENVDARAVVRELPARAAAGRVPRRDGGRTADVGEARKRTKGGVT